MTNLSDLLPSGGGAKEFTATASGAISQGKTVALQSDGTIKAVESSPSAIGTEGVLVNSLNPGSTYNDNINVTYCSGSDRYVVTYRNGDNNFYWTSRVCQANGTQLTVGSPYVIQSYGTNNDTIYYDSSADRVVHVSSSGSGISARVGEINASANTITWGSNNTLYSGSWKFRGSCFDTSTNLGFFQGNHPTNQYLYAFLVVCNPNTNFASLPYTDTIANNVANGDYGGDCTFDSNLNLVIGCYNLSNRSAGLEAQAFRLINNNSGQSFTKGGTLEVVQSSSGFSFGSVSIHWDTTAQAAIVLAEKSSGSNQGAYTWTIITNSLTSLSRDPNNNTGVELAGNSTSRYHYPYHITSDGKNGFIAMSRWQSNYGVYVQGSIQTGPTSPTWTNPTSGNLTGTKALYYGEVAYNSTDQKFLFVYNTDFADTDYRTFNYETSNNSDFIGITSEAIANSATGKVNPQGGVATAQASSTTNTVGAASEFASNGAAVRIASTYDSNSNRIVVAYTDTGNAGKGTASVGTVSGETISWGPQALFLDAYATYSSITFDSSNNKVVIAYRDAAGQGYAVVGTVDPSNNTITFGSPTQFESGSTQFISTVFDSSNNKVVIAYQDDSDGDKGKAVVGVVSGTAITFSGSIAEFHTGSLSSLCATYDSTNNRVVCFFRNNSNNYYGTGVVGEVSGNNISFGAINPFNSSATLFETQAGTFDSTNNKAVVAYRDVGASSYGTAIVATVNSSNNTISYGTPKVFSTATTQDVNATFDSNVNKIVISYHLSSSAQIITGSVSGTSINYDTATQINSAIGYYLPLAFDSTAKKVVVAYRDNGNNQHGTAKVITPTGTLENFTIGSTYYIQNNGNLTTTSSAVTAGKAISTTQLILNGAS